MAKTMKITAIISLLLTLICTLLHIETANGILLTLAITFGTTAYHFCMRLLVGEIITAVLHNKVDYNKKWFKAGKTEQVIYNRLKVKNRKDKMPTYDKSLFDRNKHSWEEIAQVMCLSGLKKHRHLVYITNL